jgi:hypothetical protein
MRCSSTTALAYLTADHRPSSQCGLAPIDFRAILDKLYIEVQRTNDMLRRSCWRIRHSSDPRVYGDALATFRGVAVIDAKPARPAQSPGEPTEKYLRRGCHAAVAESLPVEFAG